MTINFKVWDIETVANARARDFFAKKKYEAPKNYKDPQKIEEAITTARHEDAQKAALYWWTGQIVCISAQSLQEPHNPITLAGPDEKELIARFFDHMAQEENRPVLIGKHADHFDKPYLVGRAMAHDLGIPDFLRPYRPIDDIDHIFGFGARATQVGKLNDYAFGLGLESKSGHGTDVQGWFNLAELGDATMWQKIGGYCHDDVSITREVLRRYLKSYQPRVAPAKARAATPEATEPSASEIHASVFAPRTPADEPQQYSMEF